MQKPVLVTDEHERHPLERRVHHSEDEKERVEEEVELPF